MKLITEDATCSWYDFGLPVGEWRLMKVEQRLQGSYFDGEKLHYKDCTIMLSKGNPTAVVISGINRHFVAAKVGALL